MGPSLDFRDHNCRDDTVIAQKPILSEASIHQSNGKLTSLVLHHSLHQIPQQVLAAKGHYLKLADGRKVFDATGGAAVACIGHGNERIRDVVFDQMTQVSYCHTFFYGTDASEDLARFLIDSTYGEMARAYISSSGSEAVESALKIARQYHLEKTRPEPQRTNFIARHRSYHGTTIGTLSVGGHAARKRLYLPLLSTNNSFVSPCFAYRGRIHPSESDSEYVARLEEEADAEFQRVGPDTVAAFVAEPVVGAALGCVPPVKGYFQAIRRVCDRYGALLIFDEVMSGCGRIGPVPTERYPEPLHAWQDPLIGVTPDLITMGKGLGGGYMPVAAMLANHRVVNMLSKGSGAFSHGQTYQGHPVACRAALEVQRIISEERFVDNARQQGAQLGRLLKEKLSSHWAVGDIRGKGLFWGIEFVAEKSTKQPFKQEDAVSQRIHELALQEPYNMSLYPGSGTADGSCGDHVLIAPAYNVVRQDVIHIADTTARVVNIFFRDYFSRDLADLDHLETKL